MEDTPMYYIGWRSLLIDAEGQGSVAFSEKEAVRLIEAANREFAGQVEHFLIPARKEATTPTPNDN